MPRQLLLAIKVSNCVENRFSVKRAMEAGVQPGPMYAKLQHGNAVTLTNGKTVCPYCLATQFVSLAGLNP